MMNTAKAALFMGPETPFEIREFPLTTPPEGYARLSLVASGVCGTDMHFYTGKLAIDPPKIIGHEFIGRVEELPAGYTGDISVGDNVIVDIACPCGECALCGTDDDANCVNMGVTNGGDPETVPHFWGGFAEANYSPIANLVRIPVDLDPVMTSVFACAGPTALHAFALARRSNVPLRDAKVAVVQGTGPVGSFAIMYLKSLGIPNIVAITLDEDPARDALSRKLGVTEFCYLSRMSEDEIAAHIAELNGGLGADLVFEASGSPAAVPVGMQILRNRGVYLVPGQYSNRGGISIQPQLITFKALQLIGSSQYSMSDVYAYLQFLLDNPQLHGCIRDLATTYTVEEINTAFADMRAQKNIKTLLVK